VKQGYLKEATLTGGLGSYRADEGMFDPPEMVPFTKIDEGTDSAEHRALALLANELMVLLKNDGSFR
jgi:beta-glucosidase